MCLRVVFHGGDLQDKNNSITVGGGVSRLAGHALQAVKSAILVVVTMVATDEELGRRTNNMPSVTLATNVRSGIFT